MFWSFFTIGILQLDQNWIFGGFLKILVFAVFAHFSLILDISQSNLFWLQLSCAYSFKDISKIPTLFSSQEQGASNGISSFFVGLLV